MCKTRLTSLRDYCIIKLLRVFTHVVKALIFLLLTESSGCIQCLLLNSISHELPKRKGATTSRTGPKDNTRISNSVSSSWSYRSVIRYSCSSSFCVSFSKWEKCKRTRSKPLRSSWRSKGVLQEVIANQLLPSFLQPRELLQLTGPIRKIGSKTKGNNNVVYSCKYHVVWSPKYRRKVLVNGVDVRLKALIEEVCNDYHIDIIEMEIMPDHGRHLYDLCCSRNAR